MGYVSDRTHVAKDGRRTKRYLARWQGADGQPASKSFARKLDAERHVVLMESAVLRGEYVDPRHGRLLFSEVAETWRAAQVHRDSTAQAVAGDLRLHVLPTFGARPIGAVRPSEVQAWVKRLSETLAPGGVARAYSWLGAVFAMAVADGLIARTPCAGVKLPPRVERQVVPLAVEEVEALMGALPERYRALAVTGAGAGLRISEALGLTVPHVDFLRRTLRVTQQLVTGTGRPPYLGDVKGKASVRTIPVGDVVITALAEHLRRFPATTEMTGYRSGVAEPLVFTRERGQAIRRNDTSELLRPAFRGAGLPDTVSFHDLRHFYASLLISRGASVKVVQERLGHASAVETLRTYTHLWPDDDALSRTAVDEVLGTGAHHLRTTEATS